MDNGELFTNQPSTNCRQLELNDRGALLTLLSRRHIVGNLALSVGVHMAHKDTGVKIQEFLIIGDLSEIGLGQPQDPRRRKERQDFAMFPEKSSATANLPEKPIFHRKGY